MYKNRMILMTGVIFSLLLAGCNMPAEGGAGPNAWIDTPLNGMTLPLEPVVVRSHSASEDGTASAALYVNGVQVRADNVLNPSERLVEISQVWQPTEPGDYVLQVVATDGSGNAASSISVRVHIGGSVANPTAIEGGQAAEAADTPETRIPSGLQPDTSTLTASVPVVFDPTFTFTVNANCREGPGTAFEVEASFFQGQSAQIDGRNQGESRWWWVRVSGGGHCWVSDSTGIPSGPIGNVQAVYEPPPPVVIEATEPPEAPPPPPPPAVETAPAAPGNLSVTNHVCGGSTYSVTLGWQDNADNELGYRVYRNGSLITTLGTNNSSYTDFPPVGGPYTYKVEAFNNNGSQSASTSDPGCMF